MHESSASGSIGSCTFSGGTEPYRPARSCDGSILYGELAEPTAGRITLSDFLAGGLIRWEKSSTVFTSDCRPITLVGKPCSVQGSQRHYAIPGFLAVSMITD